jgi:hypothetical protein
VRSIVNAGLDESDPVAAPIVVVFDDAHFDVLEFSSRTLIMIDFQDVRTINQSVASVLQSLVRKRVCSEDHQMSCISNSSKFQEEAVLKYPFKVQGCSDLGTCCEKFSRGGVRPYVICMSVLRISRILHDFSRHAFNPRFASKINFTVEYWLQISFYT